MNTGNEAIGNNILLDWGKLCKLLMALYYNLSDAALKQSEANYEGLCEGMTIILMTCLIIFVLKNNIQILEVASKT